MRLVSSHLPIHVSVFVRISGRMFSNRAPLVSGSASTILGIWPVGRLCRLNGGGEPFPPSLHPSCREFLFSLFCPQSDSSRQECLVATANAAHFNVETDEEITGLHYTIKNTIA